MRCLYPSLMIVAAGGSMLPPSSSASERTASFPSEVMAVLSRAGCNQGSCHGNKEGKGGLKLSLRGENPAADYTQLTRGLGGRRLNPIEPEKSLLLRKPSGQLPHEGGRRFAPESVEYKILRDWIANGLLAEVAGAPQVVDLEVDPTERVLFDPEDRVVLRAEARHSDGSRRDVTRLVVFEPSAPSVAVSPDGTVQRLTYGEAVVLVRYLHLQRPVRLAFRPPRRDTPWRGPEPRHRIDELVFARLRRLEIEPSELADDRMFLRRIHVDVLGLLPTAEEVQSFLSDLAPDKRERCIDALLERPERAEKLALAWSDLLRNEERSLDPKGVEVFHQWMRRSFQHGKPLDEFVRELLTARGSTYRQPPANFYRSARDPVTRAESAAQVFLGLRLQCAKCHNHPFDRWSQDDYYAWTGFFAGIEYKILDNRRRDQNDSHEFAGEQVVWMKPRGGVEDPRTGSLAPLRLLGEQAVAATDGGDRLQRLAAWATHPQNPYFARAQANRIWARLVGRGLVDPIDDFRATNPPTHPELLDYLAAELARSGFDSRHLERLILTSRTYQLSSVPNPTNADDESGLSRAIVRRLTAEELLDAQHRIAAVPAAFSGFPAGMRAGELPGIGLARALGRAGTGRGSEQFLAAFGKPLRLLVCECERANETTLAQVFQLLSGPTVNALVTNPENRVHRGLGKGRDAESIIAELYWASLGRAPGQAELTRALPVSAGTETADVKGTLEDLLWSLLCAREVLFRS